MNISGIKFSPYSYNKALAFKATPEEIAKEALAVDTKGGMTGTDFGITYEDEKIEDLRKAAELIRTQQNNPKHLVAQWLDRFTDVLEKQ